ncbi:MAG: hypothetical protein HQ536_03975 [Parcubacteria group bacterium]|nr:hypothetical protein [Parcubacteria group bacterium]
MKQIISDNELLDYISILHEIIKPTSKEMRIFRIFSAFICVVANDYPERTKEYLSVLAQATYSGKPILKLIK